MAQTGKTLYDYLQQVSGQAYTGFLDTFKADRIFQDALIKALQEKYYGEENQKSKDIISTIVTTNNIFTPVNNLLSTDALQITTITVFNPITFEITTELPHNLATGDKATMAGVLGTGTMTSITGIFFVTVIDSTTFQIGVGSATGVHTANTGTVVSDSIIADYWHLLSMKVKFLDRVYDFTITAATNATPIILTINTFNSFRTGELLSIAGVLGNTAANGQRFIKVINTKQIALFSDKDLQVPIVGNGAYTGGGAISRVYYNYTTPFISEEKIGSLNIPSVENPGVEVANNFLKIYPLDSTSVEVTIDYLRTPDQLIITADNVIDLTLYYPEHFLLYVVNVAAQIFATQVRDTELYQQEATEKVEKQ